LYFQKLTYFLQVREFSLRSWIEIAHLASIEFFRDGLSRNAVVPNQIDAITNIKPDKMMRVKLPQ